MIKIKIKLVDIPYYKIIKIKKYHGAILNKLQLVLKTMNLFLKVLNIRVYKQICQEQLVL